MKHECKRKKYLKHLLNTTTIFLIVLSMTLLSFTYFVFTTHAANETVSSSFPNNMNGYGKAWDGVDFEAMIGQGVYYGNAKHATHLADTYSSSGFQSIISRENLVSKETSPTPILWRVMGDEGDGFLSMLSEHVVDGRAYSYRDGNDGQTSVFPISRIMFWSYVREYGNNSYYGPFTDGFLKSFDNGAEATALQDSDVITRLYDRYNGIEYSSSSYLPASWSAYEWARALGVSYPDTTRLKVYLPWGHAGGYNPGIVFGSPQSGIPEYPHDNSGKLYWNASTVSNDDYLIGYSTGDGYDTQGHLQSIPSGDILATLKNGTPANYWTRSSNVYDNGKVNAYGDGKTYGWSNDGHSIYPLYVSNVDGGIRSFYPPQTVLGVRPIVKLDPEHVIFAHEIVSTIPENTAQLNIADRDEQSDTWNYDTSTIGTNYKLTIVDNDKNIVDLNEIKMGDTTLENGISTIPLQAGDSVELKGSTEYVGDYLAYKIVKVNSDGKRTIVGYGTNKNESDRTKLTVYGTNNATDSLDLDPTSDYLLYMWAQTEDENGIASFSGSQPWYFPLELTQEKYSVTYHGNGETGGTIPTDGHSPYVVNDIVTVLDKGDLFKTGYSFQGWATSVENAVAYTAGQSFKITADIELYAKWLINTYTVTYEPGTRGTFNKNEHLDVKHGDNHPVFSEKLGSDGKPSGEVGYSFIGWDTEPTATVTKDVTYVAQWKANTDTVYKIEHYLEQTDGTYQVEEIESLSGTTDTTVSAKSKTYSGYRWNTLHADTAMSGIVAGDGSLVLRLYYSKDKQPTTPEKDVAVVTESLPKNPVSVQATGDETNVGIWMLTMLGIVGIIFVIKRKTDKT
jgi:hypothetical protein